MVLSKALILYKETGERKEQEKLSFYRKYRDIIEGGQFHGSKIPDLPHKKGMENFGR